MTARPAWRGVIDEYRELMTLGPEAEPVTLLEGNTNLYLSEHLSDALGMEVHLKWEGLNPTGSFKDRGMTVAVTQAAGEGKHAIMCASTGNTSASAAAYAAKAGMKAFVLLPEGLVAKGKLARRSPTARR